jgi:hypothetical protein
MREMFIEIIYEPNNKIYFPYFFFNSTVFISTPQ